MFFYNSTLLMDGEWLDIGRAFLTAVAGVYLLSSGMQGWFAERPVVWFNRILLVVAALFLIEGGLTTDLIGAGVTALVFFIQRVIKPKPDAMPAVRGAD
ncbi:MAG: hypothetical protein AAFO58_10205 [Pseudomonadota bacterium]